MNLLCGVLIIPLIFHGHAEASKMECRYDFLRLNVEPVLQANAQRTYTVNISCKIQFTHKGKSTEQIEKDEALSPVVVESFGLDDKTLEKNAEYCAAYQRGVDRANLQGLMRLSAMCKVVSLIDGNACNCKETGCNCMACNPPPKESRQVSGVKDKQRTGTENSILNPAILKKIKNIGGIATAQQEYINKNHEGYVPYSNMYTMHHDQYIQIVLIRNEDGEEESVYFDMTNAYNKLKSSKSKEAKRQIKELMENHMPLQPKTRK